MSNYTDRLARSITNIERILKTVTVGKDQKTRLIDAALERAEAWSELPRPSVVTVGGSTSPEEAEELLERIRVIRMAAAAAQNIPAKIKLIETLSYEIYGDVQRLTAVVDPAKYDKPVEPGCKSCERSEGKGAGKIGGHWAPIYDKSVDHGLCRWCWRHSSDPADKDTWPSIKACDVMHTQTPSAGARLLTKETAA